MPLDTPPGADLVHSVGGAEIVGRPPGFIKEAGRYSVQQDTVLVLEPKSDFFSLQTQERESHYKEAFKAAQEAVPKGGGGTTGLMVGATFTEDKRTLNLHSANTGDSGAFLIVYNSKGKINHQKSRMLNALHHSDNLTEVTRVQSAGGNINQKGYLNDWLACTRSLESKSSPGLSNDPEYLEETVQLEEDEKAIVVTSCDGMLDAFPYVIDTGTAQGRQKMCHCATRWMETAITAEDLLHGEPRYIASKLLKKSADDSDDNISILVQRLSPEKPSILLGVFDGHGSGGENASKAAAQAVSSHLGKSYDTEKLLVCDHKKNSIEAITHFIDPIELDILLESLLKEAGFEGQETALYKKLFIELSQELKKETQAQGEETYPEAVRQAMKKALQDITELVKYTRSDPADKIQAINKRIDEFIDQMSILESASAGASKKSGLTACRALGAFAGLLLTPIAPFAAMITMPKHYLNKKEDPSRTDYCIAIGIGFGSFIAGTVLSPFVAMGLGDQLAKTATQGHEKAKQNSQPTALAASRLQGLRLFKEPSPTKEKPGPKTDNSPRSHEP